MSDENMQDHVYIKIKLSLKENQTEEELQDIVQELEEKVAELEEQLQKVSVGYQQVVNVNNSLTMLTQKYEETINLLTARLLEARAQP